MKRASRWTLAASLMAATGACTAPAEGSPDNCPKQLAEDEAKVRTTRDWAEYLPGFADYLDIHWQAKAEGDPCSRAPGPTDWQYDMVLRLRHDQAVALAANLSTPTTDDQSDFDPAEPQIWPKLAPFVTPGATWLHNAAWDDGASSTKRLRVWLDAAHDLAYVSLLDQ